MWLLNADAPADAARDPARLELFFGILAMVALVSMWAWLWLRTRKPPAERD